MVINFTCSFLLNLIFWYTIFRTAKGNIELSIDHNGVSSCYVMLRYFDKINTNAVEQQAMNDL